MARRHFGNVRKLPSGSFQASFWHEGARHLAETTFPTKTSALNYLATVETDLHRGAWVDEREGNTSVESLSRLWLESNPAKRPDTLATG